MDFPSSEVSYLKDCLNKQHEQQCLLEQIVSNISSLVEGSGDPMCIFDKDGFFMHVNAACRKLLGITEQHTSQKNIFDYYTSWDRDRIFKDSVQRRAMKWGGHVSFIKHGHEIRVYQVIELLHSSKNLEGTFFKSYITLQQDNSIQEKLQVYYDMIRHMPVGVGIWRLEKGANMSSVLRLVCANCLASQYVGVTLQIGKDIHETLPNGSEVHKFLEDVITNQRVSTLDKFRTATGREVAVTAFPLSQEYVVVALESPKTDNWVSAIDSTGLGVSLCEGLRISHCNEPFASMLGNPKEVCGKDVVHILEQHARSSSRQQLFDLRRAIQESRIHYVEIDLEQHQWRICVHPLSDSLKRFIILAYRINTKPPSLIHRGTFPILPHLRDALPLSPTPVQSPTSTQTQASPQSSASGSTSTLLTATPKAHPSPPGNTHSDSIFFELVENFPCGVAIVKAERHQDITRFRFVAVNRAARVFSNHLIIGKYFEEASPLPFDTPFVRLLLVSSQTHERRVAARLNLYGSCLSLAARTIPLHDHCIGIAFEEASVMAPQASVKRSSSEIDCGHQILPSHKHPRLPSNTQTSAPQAPSVQATQTSPAQTISQSSAPQVTPTSQSKAILEASPSAQPDRATSFQSEPPQTNRNPRQLAHSFTDVEQLPFTATLPKPFLPPIHSTTQSSISDMLSSSREKFESNIFQQCVVGIASCDTKGQLSVVNRAFSQMLGYIEYELVDQSILPLISADDAVSVKSVLQKLACGELKSLDMPLRFLHKHSHTVLVLVTFLVHKSIGERTRIVFQVQQPSKLQNFPEVLFAEREIVRTAFRDLTVGCAVLSPSLSIICANNVFCDMLGVKEDELTDQPWAGVVCAGDYEVTTKALLDTFNMQSLHQKLSLRVTLKSGPAHAALSIGSILDSNAKPFLLVVQLQLTDQPS